jgi:hypothetical protein
MAAHGLTPLAQARYKRHTDHMDLYRRNEHGTWTYQHRAAIIGAISVPRHPATMPIYVDLDQNLYINVGHHPGPPKPVRRGRRAGLNVNFYKYHKRFYYDAATVTARKTALWQYTGLPLFRTRRSPRLVRLIGWGGQGVTSLWEMNDAAGARHVFVVKGKLADTRPPLTAEVVNQGRFTGGKHFSQLFQVPVPLPAGTPDAHAHPELPAQAVNLHQDLHLAEYCPDGDFSRVIIKMSDPQKNAPPTPNRILWALFECCKSW